jgi:uncharacterized surface protein with fasciclin (FAS1) repeats
MALSQVTYAQGSSKSPAATNQPAASTDQAASSQRLGPKLRAMLEKSGYTDIRVAPTSFMVHAKDADGNPVVMTISPDSFTEVTDVDDASGKANAANGSEKTVMVGGAAMFPSKNIIQNAENSKDHTTLVAAVKAAGLVDTLEGKGPFTVFAPTNEAFKKLPAGTVEKLLKPDEKATLSKILTYHVVPGKLEASDLTDGKKLKTVQGEELTVKNKDGKISIVDAKGDSANVTIDDVNQSNGVIHVIDSVLMPS